MRIFSFQTNEVKNILFLFKNIIKIFHILEIIKFLYSFYTGLKSAIKFLPPADVRSLDVLISPAREILSRYIIRF